MYYPSKAVTRQVQQNADHGTPLMRGNFLIPLKKEIDLTLRPQEIYRRICSSERPAGFSFLLESCRTHPKTGRFSFVGSQPFLIFKSKARNIHIIKNGRTKGFLAHPIKVLRSLLNGYRSIKIPGISGFTGGAVGYFSYDCCHLFEKLPKTAKDDLGLPDIFLIFVDTVAAYDHLENKLVLISNIYPDKPLDEAYEEAVERIERLEEEIRQPSRGGCSWERSACSSGKPRSAKIFAPPTSSADQAAKTFERPTHSRPSWLPYFQSTFTKQNFEDIVRRAKEYIRAGDIYQANLSQRFCADIGQIEPLALYERLSDINPSPFACYLDFGELKIASSSPERLLKLEDRFVQTRPIAGTRPRGKTPSEDLALSCELMLSDKERAEHIMLVDLERNDLGRVCEYGTVKVDELMVLEDYSHVIHIVSNVSGRLRSDKDRFDLLRAVFPGGTITGCPKIRCMEIIDELEPVTRNVYTGSIGYLDFNQDMDLNIVIRTFLIKEKQAYVQVGAGIVADSDPQREYYETLYKAEALFRALESQKIPISPAKAGSRERVKSQIPNNFQFPWPAEQSGQGRQNSNDQNKRFQPYKCF